MINGDLVNLGGGEGVEIITLSTEDGTAFISALTQFVTAAIDQPGSPVRTVNNVSFSAYADIMAALGHNKVVYVKNTVGIEATIAITQFTNGLFTFSITNMSQPVGNVTVAYTVTISVNGVEIYCYGFATVLN